ncbi:MAG: shikimate dehydrogenase [Alistipes sp.]|nr:shikimate dehydrogenase [Alistipes sp.]
MRYFGLIGKSLSHSFSQKFFTAKFAADGIEACYDLLEIDSISKIDRLIAEKQLSGFNVTIPYKESIIPYLDDLSNEAREVGAVNCVVIKDARKVGYNTDVMGIDATLEWLDTTDVKVLILGTGGASKALQHVLRKRSMPYSIVSRDKQRGDYTYDEVTPDVIAEHGIIVNTTPVGMFPNVDAAPAICYDAITPKHQAFDMVYNPAKTRFLELCEAQGAKTMGGMLMLQTQAIASWHLWQER